MARGRRSEGLELNFDGLTDAVTNLVGALLLLVVLVLGLSRPKTSDSAVGGQTAAEQQLDVLRNEIRDLHGQVDAIEPQLRQLRERAKALGIETSDSVQLPRTDATELARGPQDGER